MRALEDAQKAKISIIEAQKMLDEAFDDAENEMMLNNKTFMATLEERQQEIREGKTFPVEELFKLLERE